MEGAALIDRWRAPPLDGLDTGGLAAFFGAADMGALWEGLGARPFPLLTDPVRPDLYKKTCPADEGRILEAAAAALDGRIELLGSGPVRLDRPYPWHRDLNSGHQWALDFHRDIDVNDLARTSDVKLPWELSRLQWAIPAGQAYLLSGEAGYAEFTRALLEDWIEANPYGRGVNWISAMEAAMRIFTWVWFFHVFHRAPSWEDEEFRHRFLLTLYRHGCYARRYLDDFGHSGNHCVADGAGLVVAGLFFGESGEGATWARIGWRVLERELFRQVHADGVDFEASAAYHRLVAELFLLPAMCRDAAGLSVSDEFRARLGAMGDFSDAYMAGQASAPLWGDGDDGRVLPFGGQAVGDHRYLAPLIGAFLGTREGRVPELFWVFGPENGGAAEGGGEPRSRVFPEGGVYIMAGSGDRVFIDCGPVGFAGRGGHGHNDCLAIDVVLDGQALISDCGSYVYTASAEWRNQFRATAQHNTPRVDGAEQNRFFVPDELFRLHDDAAPEPRLWRTDETIDYFEGSHGGYPIRPVRRVVLDRENHRLTVEDRFEGGGAHHVAVPYHLAPGVGLERLEDGLWRLRAGDKNFLLACLDTANYAAAERQCWISPSYGVKIESLALEFSRDGSLMPLRVALYPEDGAPADPGLCFAAPD